METKNFKYAVAALLLLIAAVAEAGPAPPKPFGTFTVEVKATPAEQFAYATRIIPASADLSARNLAVIRSVEALAVIPRHWPEERALSLRAYREMVSRLAGARLYGNAIAICDTAIAFADKSPQALVFMATKGRSLMWLGRTDEAREAFGRATTGDFNRLDDFDKSSILLDAVLFYERDKNFVAAAKYARARAKVAGNDFGRAEAMRKALELSMQANDHASAKADLAGLSDAALDARMHTLTPEESEVLRRIDTEIAQYRKKLGM